MNFLKSLLPNSVPSNINPDNQIAVLRDRILQTILWICCFLGIFAVVPGMVTAIQGQIWVVVISDVAGYLFIIALTFVRRIPYSFRAMIFMFIFFILGVTNLAQRGLSGNGRIFLVCFSILMVILMSTRAGAAGLILSGFSMAVVGSLMVMNIIPLPPLEIMANSGNSFDWITASVLFIGLTLITSSALSLLVTNLNSTMEKQKILSNELLDEKQNLEIRVNERTSELMQRASQLEAANHISHELSTSIKLEDVLINSVNIVQKEFSLYHVDIFILNEDGIYADLVASTGEEGKRLLESNYRLRVSEIGILTSVIKSKEPRVANNVLEDPLYIQNPFLPETRSEAALPLQTGDKIIGALDVQSSDLNAFPETSIKILDTISDQIALAIQNARLVSQLEANLAELEKSYMQYTRNAWQRQLGGGRSSISIRNIGGNLDENVSPSDEAKQAYRNGKVTVQSSLLSSHSKVAMPIRLRDQVLGVIDLEVETIRLNQEFINLIQSVSDRLAIALDNARLLEEIQRRADRERKFGEISSRIRSSTEVDEILKTAALELGRAVGISEVVVQIRPSE